MELSVEREILPLRFARMLRVTRVAAAQIASHTSPQIILHLPIRVNAACHTITTKNALHTWCSAVSAAFSFALCSILLISINV